MSEPIGVGTDLGKVRCAFALSEDKPRLRIATGTSIANAMSRRVYYLLIALVILFGLLFLLSRMDGDQPLKPMEAPVVQAAATK